MSDAELLSRWYVILAVAGAIVALVALLLIAVLVTARRIERAAVRCLLAVQRIAENMAPIWELEKTNAAAWELRETARSIREHGEQIAEALRSPAGRG
jgi:hypothetical protein